MGVNSRRRPRNKREEEALKLQQDAQRAQQAEAAVPEGVRKISDTIKAVLPSILGGIMSVTAMLLVSYMLTAEIPPPEEADPGFAVPSWLEVTGKVPRLTARELAERNSEFMGRPVVLTDSKWSKAVIPANWTADDLADVLPELNKVRKLVDNADGEKTVFLYEDNRRMMRAWDADGALLGKPEIEVVDAMSARDFFESEEPLYFSHIWDDELEQKFGASLPVRDLRILSQFSPRNRSDTGVFKLNFWLTPDDAVAGMHYDPNHNMFGQVSGCKRFVLVDASEWAHLQLYPLYHPNDRQSQWERMPEDATPLTPIPAVVADLVPGDTLYLPPMTFHRVATFPCRGQRHSASVNGWSRGAPEAVFEATQHLDNLPSLFVDVTAETMPKALPSAAYFIGRVLSEVVTSTSADAFISENVVDQRYMASSAMAHALSCGDDFDAERCPAGVVDPVKALAEVDPDLRAQLDKDIETTVALFQEHRAHIQGLELLVADFVERVATLVVGIPKVCTLLRCLAASPFLA